MPAFRQQIAAVTALIRDKGDQVDNLLCSVAEALQARGLKVAGVVQETQLRKGRRCGDFSLRNLDTGECYPISQNLGRGSRGCRLDYSNLASALSKIERGLTQQTDTLILNRFGYSESQGGGFRPLIERAVGLGVPVLLTVNRSYLNSWQAYAGTFSSDLPATVQNARAWQCALMQASVSLLADVQD